MSLSERLQVYQSCVETALDYWLPAADLQPRHLHKAMRYAVLGDGKRIRPVLVYATGETFGVDLGTLNGPACAVEMIHAYSLIHDDLPAMDNDDLRRGRPTCHKAFDEATAILAGDALQALAFHVLAHAPEIKVSAKQRLVMIDILAQASGSRGMAGGQAIDLAAVGQQLNIAELENMHIHKTGALIRASVELGALSANDVDPEAFEKVSHYAKCIGLAFQIQDDILDVESDTETLGKPQGSDMQRNKPTYPNLLGMDGAKEAAQRLHTEALDSLKHFDSVADPLRWIADYIVQRRK
ncbi:MAG: (2E,6E)-farnesyl diphosphate synthase [Gammaproteobacteria bacterium]|nr:(2E,6E)-farnesyl diphosphate synthase [Gammaproteobacteria bacterium]